MSQLVGEPKEAVGVPQLDGSGEVEMSEGDAGSREEVDIDDAVSPFGGVDSSLV